MSLYDYEVSKQLAMEDLPFAALIMAAMRKADTTNSMRLKQMWPGITRELEERYNAPGGILPTDPAQHPANRDEWAEENQ